MSIGERITSLRKEQNISQTQLAKAMGVSRQAVSKWENDQTSPDTLNLIKLCDILNTEVEYLATGKGPAEKSEPVIVKVVEKVDNVIEKVVEKPVVKIVDRPIIRTIEKPVIQKVNRTKYLRNPVEFALVGFAGVILGFLIGLLF